VGLGDDDVLSDSVSDVSGDVSTAEDLLGFLTGSEFLFELGNQIFVGLGGDVESIVFGLEFFGVGVQVVLSGLDEGLGFFDLSDGSFQEFGLFVQFNGESVDFTFLVGDVLDVGGLGVVFFLGGLGDGVFQVSSDVEQEFLNLLQSFRISEFG